MRTQPSDKKKHLMEILDIYTTDVLGVNIRRNTRKRDYVEARAVFYRLCKDVAKATTPEIGFYIEKDHATIVHGLGLFNDVLWNDKRLRESYLKIIDLFNETPVGPKKKLSETVEFAKENLELRNKLETLHAQLTREKLTQSPERELAIKWDRLSPKNKRDVMDIINAKLVMQPEAVYDIEVVEG